MALSDADRRAAADALWQAAADRVPIEPLSSTFASLDVDDAYDIQLRNVRRRLDAGALVRGHKVGLTARAMQQMLGVSEPDYGHLLDDMFVFEDDVVEPGRFLAPRIEPEVAFVLGRPLRGPGCSVADVLRATDFVLPALEIIDSRIVDWRITLPDTIADNASSAGIVLGGHPVRPGDVDLRLVGVTMARNGEVAETGTAAAVLGNPASAVAWVANALGPLGVTLEEGSVILPGSCTRAVDVRPGDAVRADFTALGAVSVRFA